LYIADMKLPVPLLLFSVLIIPPTSQAQSYERQLEQWYEAREKSLKAENGWLNLVGLLWINEGSNEFGSDSAGQLVFPKKLPSVAGVFERKGNTVWLNANIPILVNGVEKKEALVFHADSTRNPIMQYGDLRWNSIKREDKLGVRLRDLKSDALQSFRGIEHYPVNRNLIIEARYEPHTVPTSISITNILGQTTKQFSPGIVYFSLAGKSYTMIALEEEGELFFVFGDPTNDIETYSAGRFLKAVKPAVAGTVLLDFNKAYNPPCAFTPYATCPLPPKQNMLEVPVKAGEKNYSNHH
jgi:uncharacterized protein (DUF1684 family)